MGICFQTLCPRKRGFLHETGFSLPHRYHFDGRGYVLPNRKSLIFDYLKSRQMRWFKNIQNNLNWAWLLTQGTQAVHARDRNQSAAKPSMVHLRCGAPSKLGNLPSFLEQPLPRDIICENSEWCITIFILIFIHNWGPIRGFRVMGYRLFRKK